jgi:hypothetical protein
MFRKILIICPDNQSIPIQLLNFVLLNFLIIQYWTLRKH